MKGCQPGDPRAVEAGRKDGLIQWMPSDEYFRPTLWIALPHSYLVLVLGMEWPRVLWLR